MGDTAVIVTNETVLLDSSDSSEEGGEATGAEVPADGVPPKEPGEEAATKKRRVSLTFVRDL